MKQHQLNGQIGTDPMFVSATHTGHCRTNVKHDDIHPKMQLTHEEQSIFDGDKGELLQKSIRTVDLLGQEF
jgi:hypothetical protein